MTGFPFNLLAIEKQSDIANWRSCSPDHPPCAICKNPITDGIPLRAFDEKRNLEIAFHMKCCSIPGRVYPLEGDETDEEIAENEENVECFYCKKLEKCPHISENYKGKLKNLPK